MLGVGRRLLRQFRPISLACSSTLKPVTFFILHEYSASIEDAFPGDSAEPMFVGTSNPGDSPVINEIFSMFKSYLKVKLDGKSKQIKSKSKVVKQVTHKIQR